MNREQRRELEQTLESRKRSNQQILNEITELENQVADLLQIHSDNEEEIAAIQRQLEEHSEERVV